MFEVESRFCQRIDCSYVTLLSTYPAKKAMFKVNSRNTRKICLLISKITLKPSKRRHQLFAGGIYPELCLGQFFLEYIPIFNQKAVFSSAFNFDGLQFQQQQTHICHYLRNEKSLSRYFIHEKFKMSAFCISEKTTAKMEKNFLPYIHRVTISVSQSQTS